MSAHSHDPEYFVPHGMTHGDFFIGCEFLTGGGQWRCTDIGTRVIVAMRIDEYPDDPSWYNGPPYAVAECVFDEYDQEGCTPLPLPAATLKPPEPRARVDMPDGKDAP